MEVEESLPKIIGEIEGGRGEFVEDYRDERNADGRVEQR